LTADKGQYNDLYKIYNDMYIKVLETIPYSVLIQFYNSILKKHLPFEQAESAGQSEVWRQPATH
jgi:hypothetical protein